MAHLSATTGPSAGRGRRSAWRIGAALPALALTLALSAPVLAQVQGSGNRHFAPAPATTGAQDNSSGRRHFAAAPGTKGDEDSGDSIEAAIGISTNALFFAVVAVIGVFWFTVGGGRRARKLGRQE